MTSADSSSGAAVRALAARLNAEVVAGGRSVQAFEGRDRALPARDRPLLRALLLGSLRWHHRLDWMLGRLLDRPLKRRDTGLAALLRIGLTQVDVLRIPDHAAVSATVAAADELGLARARGLTNAVLRRFVRERASLAEACREDETAWHSHPGWLIDALKRDWPADWAGILEANNAPPPFWVRVNQHAISRGAYLAALEAADIDVEPASAAFQAQRRDSRLTAEARATAAAELEATAAAALGQAILLAEPCPVEALPGFAAGLVSVQDAGAQLAAELMRLKPGLRVLDACAAPGGKTAHLLERCPDLAELVAVDRDADRLARVDENLGRLGLRARLVHGDAGDPACWAGDARFDRILVDAPCSATGVIRRHPDIKLLHRAGDLDDLSAAQRRLLAALWPLLAPGGRLVYATCSVLEAENLGVTEAFAAVTPDADLAPLGTRAHFQILPGEANMDGFYYACFDRGA